MSVRMWIAGSLAVAGVIVGMLPGTLIAEDASADPTPARSASRIAEAEKAAIEILLRDQESLTGGSPAEWPYEGVYRERGRIPIGYRVGGTAFCAWALLEASDEESADRRKQSTERALSFILSALRHPKMGPDDVAAYDVRGWGQTYALHFLLRVRQQDSMPEASRSAVAGAIPKLIATLQATEISDVGGWNYSRQRGLPSTFMTAATLQSLFAARAQGYAVDENIVHRALRTLSDARLPNGAFQYASYPETKSGRAIEALPGAIGRMPICEVTLYLGGQGSLQRIESSLLAFFKHWKWLEERRKKSGTHRPPYMIAPYYFYFAHYYAAQAIEFLPSSRRAEMRKRLYDRLFQVRENDGSWNDRVFPRSRNFGTAATLLGFVEPQASRPPAWKKAAPEKPTKK